MTRRKCGCLATPSRLRLETQFSKLPPSDMRAATRRNLLFVCARNKIRSLTAERLLAHSPHYSVRSRGVSREARIRITHSDIGWADEIFVIEKNHRNRILEDFAEVARGKEIVCQDIADIFEPMEEVLIEELEAKLAQHGIAVR